MVGYSRLVGIDEPGTLDRQRQVRAEIIDPLIADYGGRIVKTTGDGILVEFASVVSAVACAADIQGAMAAREMHLAADDRIRYRIGINIGDIVIDGDDILGDGVNVASRLEQLAEPGGICVSGKVVEEIANKLDLTVTFIGNRKLKNIATPVPAYHVDRRGSADRRRRRRAPAALPKRWAIVGVAILLLVGGSAAWVRLGSSPDDTLRVEPADDSSSGTPLVAVLPFVNLSDDPEQEWFVDGMTADLITDLSAIAGLRVVSRNAVFGYKDARADARQLAEELHASHVLEASVRRAGDQLRVNAELIDAKTGRQLWADRYDERVNDIFAVQDRLTRRVIDALEVTLTDDDEQELSTTDTANAAAYEAFLRGREHFRRYTPEDFALARDYFERAVDLDPAYGHAHAALALVHYRAFEQGWSRALGLGWHTSRMRAGQHMEEAWQHPTPLAHRVAAEMFLRVNRNEDALDHAEKAVELGPNDPENRASLAQVLIFLGRGQEAIELIDEAIRLDRHYPAEYLYLRGLAYFGLGEFDLAVADMLGVQARTPANHRAKVVLAASYGHLGRTDEAGDALDAYWAAETATGHHGQIDNDSLRHWWPFAQEDDMMRLLDGLAEVEATSPAVPFRLRDDQER